MQIRNVDGDVIDSHGLANRSSEINIKTPSSKPADDGRSVCADRPSMLHGHIHQELFDNAKWNIWLQ